MIIGIENIIAYSIPVGSRINAKGKSEVLGFTGGPDCTGTIKGTVIANYPFYILVNMGNYVEAINKVDILTSRINLKIQKGGENDDQKRSN